MTPIERFKAEFGPKLGHTNRWAAFAYIAESLLGLNRPVYIQETGCIRSLENWDGDGQSTRLWDWIAGETKGYVNTCDVDTKAVAVTRSILKSGSAVWFDSITELSLFEGRMTRIDLLYLDSMDYKPETQHLSALHHVGELAAAYRHLKSGCLVAVDDCHTAFLGKHVLVKAFFDSIGIRPEVEGYVTVWRKP